MAADKTPRRRGVPAFVTGSHAYGVPGPDSDIDLVVLVSQADYARLYEEADPETLEELQRAESYEAFGSVSMRFGSLNLLVCTSPEVYEVWRQGTTHLMNMRPVTREFACRTMEEFREKLIGGTK